MANTSVAQTGKRRVVKKWGFGMAPISSRMRERYDGAVQSVNDFIEGKLKPGEVHPESFSELKGMLNRCVRQDQWDWFTVYSEFGRPPIPRIRRIAEERIKEINSATGVAIPFSARSVFLVSDARFAERKIFEQLDTFRIRSDREFFQIPYQEAVKAIRGCLDEFGLREGQPLC